MGRRKKFSLRKSLGFFGLNLLFKLWIIWVRHVRFESLTSYGEKLGAIVFHLLRMGNKTALINLNLALGREKSKKEIEQICRDSFKNIGKDMMETSRVLDYDDNHLRTLARIDGREHLDQALRQGKGVIASTAHLGNFSLMAWRLAKEGYPVSIVIKISGNSKVIEPISAAVETIGLEFIPDKPRRACVARCLNVLKENRILMMQIDLNAPVTEAWVDFFGYLVPTYKGPVVLSFRTGAPIVPVFAVRNSNQLHQIAIHPPFDLNITEDRERDITSNTARLTKIVEAAIREHPEQWWWGLRRFRRARDIKTGESLFPRRP